VSTHLCLALYPGVDGVGVYATLPLVTFHATLRGELGLVAAVAHPTQANMNIPDMLLDGLDVRRVHSHGLTIASDACGCARSTDAFMPAAGALQAEWCWFGTQMVMQVRVENGLA
jgi:hypothetical protein